MPENKKPARLLAGIDNLFFDQRDFTLSLAEVAAICRFFSLGKIRYYEKEKNIIVSHSNFFFYLETNLGCFALKFYPVGVAKTLTLEYAVNRKLLAHGVMTPFIHTGSNGRPFMASRGRLAACYSYINGVPAWQKIAKPDTPSKINTALLTLKNILCENAHGLKLQDQQRFSATAETLARESKLLGSYEQQKTIDASLLKACRSFQHNQTLFTRQRLHNNASLTNFLIYKKIFYILDLSHIQEDYILTDLASLIVSCLFFKVPLSTIRAITKDYFKQHKIGQHLLTVLDTHVKINLIKEYLKNTRRERSPEVTSAPRELVKQYMSYNYKRKNLIISALKK